MNAKPGLFLPHRVWENFLIDPVMSAKVMLGYDFDAFQAARLRYHWWTPNFVDSSGYSSGKTVVDVAYICLRCLLIPGGNTALVLYVDFDNGKTTFWGELEKMAARNPFFRSQLGRMDVEGKDSRDPIVHGNSAYELHFKNRNRILMPAPDWEREAGGLASLRITTALLEEWTHVDAKTRPGSRGGINAQVIGRAATPTYNANHPIWSTHIHFTAPAAKRSHPSYRRYRDTEKLAESGDPRTVVRSWNYKHYSNRPCPHAPGKTWRQAHREEGNRKTLRHNTPNDADWLSEALGIWALSGAGWYNDQAIAACCQRGAECGVRPIDSASDAWLKTALAE